MNELIMVFRVDPSFWNEYLKERRYNDYAEYYDSFPSLIDFVPKTWVKDLAYKENYFIEVGSLDTEL